MGEPSIISIGKRFEHPSVDNIKYRSSYSLLDYSIALWDPNGLLLEYRQFNFAGSLAIDSDDLIPIQEDISRRKKEMEEFLKLGRTIIIFTPKPDKFAIGKSFKDLSDSLPINNIKIIGASGVAIEFKGSEPFNTFWRINKDYLSYRAYFEKIIGEPLFFIENTDKIIGSRIPLEKGNLIFIPNLVVYETD